MKLVILKSLICLTLYLQCLQNSISVNNNIIRDNSNTSQIKPTKSLIYSQKFFSEMKENFLSINGNLTSLLESLEKLNFQKVLPKSNETNYLRNNITNVTKSNFIKSRKTINSTEIKKNISLPLRETNLSSKLHNAIFSLYEVNNTVTKKIKSFEKFFYSDLRRIKNLNKSKKKKYVIF